MKKIITGILLISSVVAQAATYYVSNEGNNASNGTSSATPWRTLAYVSTVTIVPGDTILLRAGDTWREDLIVSRQGSTAANITYYRYGEGSNPRVLGSNQALSWTNISGNIWRSGTTLNNYSTEYYAGRIFFKGLDDSVSWGQYQGTSTASLTQEYDYVVSGGLYYVYAASNPTTRYKSVEVTQRRWCISHNDDIEYFAYMEFNSIDIMFSRMAGFYGGYPEDYRTTNITFRNARIGYIGAQPSGFAYGLEVTASNLLVENCYFSDCGRRAISFNLYLASRIERCKFENIIVRNNIFKRGYHTTSLDMSSQQTTIDTIQNVYFYNNIVDDSDFDEICSNCGSNQLFVQVGGGNSRINNVWIVSNLFIEASARNILFEGGDTSYVWNNTIIGHNPATTISPYQNVGYNSDRARAYYRNNILYDNLGEVQLDNHGVFMYYTYDGVFEEKDYNLYYSAYPGYGNDRNFSAHKINSTGAMGYWATTAWTTYLSNNTLFEQNSPTPANPLFVDFANRDYSLTQASPAVGAGLATPWLIVEDAFGRVDTVNNNDVLGNEYVVGDWDLGAFAYSTPDTTATDIVVNAATTNLIRFQSTVCGNTVFVRGVPERAFVTMFSTNGRTVATGRAMHNSVAFKNVSPGIYLLALYPITGKSITATIIVVFQ